MKVKVVLVRSLYETNIGATSRAMTNMGVQELILIDPKCEIGFPAQQAAASGQGPLQNRKVYLSWKEFYEKEPEGIRIAFSARDGKANPLWSYEEVLGKIDQEQHDTIYLIFGPEDCGLSASDKELVHFSVRLPTFGENTSLNLAQASLLALFMVRNHFPPITNIQPARKVRDESKTLAFPDATLKAWIGEMGFEIENRPVNAYTILKRILLQNLPNEEELQVLETVLQQSRRKLEEYNIFRKLYGNLPDKDKSLT